MKNAVKIIAVSALAIGSLLTSATASAGQSYGSLHYGGGYGGGHYSGGYGYSSGGHYYGGGRHHRGGRGGGHGAGYALLGFALGAALVSSSRSSRRSYDRGYGNGGYYDPAYGQPVQSYQYQPRYAPEPARQGVVNPLENNDYQSASCLQTREYQTTIIIGGEEMDAYGTACLQPDGSWLQGPARAVPQY